MTLIKGDVLNYNSLSNAIETGVLVFHPENMEDYAVMAGVPAKVLRKRG